MPFNSETAKEAGKNSKRGKAKNSSEIREMLSDLATKTLESKNIRFILDGIKIYNKSQYKYR